MIKCRKIQVSWDAELKMQKTMQMFSRVTKVQVNSDEIYHLPGFFDTSDVFGFIANDKIFGNSDNR